jgi:hypothetical protein
VKSAFENLDSDLKAEWRMLPATVAFLDALVDHRVALAAQIVDHTISVSTVNPNFVSAMGQQILAVDFAISLARRNK